MNKNLLKIIATIAIIYIVFAFVVYPMLDITPESRIVEMQGLNGKLYVDQQRNSFFPWTYTTQSFTATYDYQKLVDLNKMAEDAVNKNSNEAGKKLMGIIGPIIAICVVVWVVINFDRIASALEQLSKRN